MKDLETMIRELAGVARRVSNQRIMLDERIARRATVAADPHRTGELATIDRRIRNGEIMLADKVALHDALKARLDADVARTEVRLRPIDFDARRDPRTERWCVRCQRDLAEDAAARRVRVVHVGGCPHAMAAVDVPRYEGGRLSLPPGAEDAGWHLIGPECLRAQGPEWTVAA